MESKHKQAIKRQGLDRWHQFLRNGRWGTCVDCPKSADGRAIPELCEHTERCDHNLQPHELFEQYRDFAELQPNPIGWDVFDDTHTRAAIHNLGVKAPTLSQVTTLQRDMALAYKIGSKL